MKKLWKKFDRLRLECYESPAGLGAAADVWDKAYKTLAEAIHEGRNQDGSYASELYILDEDTDYVHDVGCWLENYLDYLDGEGQHEKLCKVCTEIIGLFQWEEDNPSLYRSYIASSLGCLGKKNEALSFCEEWYKNESENIMAATALIYARTAVGDFGGANQIAERYTAEGGSCTDENDTVYIAAETLYKVSGNQAAEKRVSQAIRRYEEEVETYFSNLGGDGLEFDLDDIDDEDLPFN